MGNDPELEFQEIESHIFHEIESFAKLYLWLICKIVQEIEKALGGHYFRVLFSYLI
jgi:hypothetical protein